MKTMKKLRGAMAAVIMFLLVFLARGNISAAEVQTIVPAVGGAESASTYQYEAPAQSKGSTVSIPVQVSRAGEVNFHLAVQSESNAIRMILSKSRSQNAASDWLDCVPNLQSEAGNLRAIEMKVYAEGACTWYLHLTPLDENAMSVTVNAYQDVNKVTSSGELKKGKWIDAYVYDEEHPAYLKIKAASAGCIKVETTSEKTVALLNSKKKEFDSWTEVTGKTVYYAVKKGTYYIKVSGAGSFRIRYTFESISVNKNTKRAKSTVLKKGKAQKGMFVVGNSSNNHWYKMTFTKDKTIKMNITIQRNEPSSQMKYYVLWEKGNNKDDISASGSLKIGKNTVKLKLKKGTYYVWLNGGIDTGSYSIQWK